MRNQEQIDAWNGETGEKWAKHTDQLDQLLSPFIPVILEAVGLHAGENILDIGCGAGALSLEAAKRLEGDLDICGVDVSSPLLEVARQRAADAGIHAEFVQSDASLFRSNKPVDAAISRFGVMFFDDPTEAFHALRRNLRPEGRIVFACWQGLKDNEWASAPGLVAKQFITTPLPAVDPLAPGPFAFADKTRVNSILSDAGWKGVSFQDWSGDIVLPGSTLEESASFILQLGPIGRLVAEYDIPMDRVKDALIEKLSEKLNADNAPALGGRVWIVSATAS